MAEEITILSVPHDATGHAKRFGAMRDHATGTWYVVGKIPAELQNYVPRPENKRFNELAPPCPSCGGPTRKVIGHGGQPFWSCVANRRAGCRGVVNYLDYLDAVAPVVKVGAFLPKVVGSLFGPAESPTTSAPKGPHPLKEKWREIVQEAATVLGDDKQAVRWLFEPKLAFKNKAPVEMCGTDAGCRAVVELLRDVWK